MYLGVDYMLRSDRAYAVFRERGVGFVVRYLCPPAWKKCLTGDEARALSEAGFNIDSVWETSGGAPIAKPSGRDFFTWAKGSEEGQTAFRVAQSIGQPAGTAIYFAVDYDAQPADMPAIASYVDAAQAQLGETYSAGVYGSFAVIDYFAKRGTRFLWQTYAWSGGRVHPKAQLYQYHNGVNIGGVATDLNKCFSDPGWWRIGGVLTLPEYKEELSVPMVRFGDKGLAVSIMQALLECPISGTCDDVTLAAVKAFQTASALSADGICGPLTWTALTKAQPKGKFALVKLAQIKAQLRAISEEI